MSASAPVPATWPERAPYPPAARCCAPQHRPMIRAARAARARTSPDETGPKPLDFKKAYPTVGR